MHTLTQFLSRVPGRELRGTRNLLFHAFPLTNRQNPALLPKMSVKNAKIAGQFVILSFVFIHIAGSICIFNIFLDCGDFRRALVRVEEGCGRRAGPRLHVTLSLHCIN